MKDRTRLIHSGQDRDPHTGASSIPIYQVSTYHQPDPEHLGPYDYGRSDNPTREALEKTLAQLEGGARGLAFASGMAATSSSLLLFQPGDHLVVGRDIYGGTYRILTTVFHRWKLDVTFVDSADPDSVRRAIRPDTRGLFVETPANPLLQITDLRAMAAIARAHGLVSIADNTFMTPFLQRPIELGFDIVVHSATKFLGGHSDLIAGAAVVREEALGRRLRAIQNAFGAILGPQDSWLVLPASRHWPSASTPSSARRTRSPAGCCYALKLAAFTSPALNNTQAMTFTCARPAAPAPSCRSSSLTGRPPSRS